ncbi:hypothetical protein BDK89_2288 [Ilumatobacter fluminis]|uniref:Uncharacterized protein n=1 Tax=Ilumatobacter fluminis TaxID=467091 RepID=A0A4R7HZY9_9ACTN|nr:hypothetical protein [Ilumatobacter fluminis]TDT16695.1 hypothetical protein BDK89_2288 [Ilumatobacter fluminis]
MAAWLTQRRLSQNATRLKQLRAELAQLDEQVMYLRSDADDTALRALVSETPGAAQEATQAEKHAAALDKTRRHVVDEIAKLEAKQDELLDRLTGS